MSDTPLPRTIGSDDAYRQRRARYALNRAYYRGEQRSRAQLRRLTTPRNFTALFVDTVTAHMGGGRVSFGDDALAEELEQFYEFVMDSEDGELFDFDAETGCAVDGDAVQKVTWDDQQQRVRLTRVDPAAVWVQTRPDDPAAVELVAQQYEVTATDAPFMFGDRLVAALGIRKKATITEAWTRHRWDVWLGHELMLSEPNPYRAGIPYVMYPNYRVPGDPFWGRGDPDRIRDLQDRFNAAAADTDWLAELAGQILVLEGVDAGGNISVRPGAVFEIPEHAKAYTLDLLQGGLQSRLDYLGDLRADMHAIARIPKTALGDSDKNLSGLALQIQLGPLIRFVHRKRLTRTAALRQRARLIAALGAQFGQVPGEPVLPISVMWDDAIPSDRADDLSNAVIELSLGRDAEAVLRSIGVDDPAAELRARASQVAAGLISPAGTQGGFPSGRTEPNPTGV